MLKNLIAYDSNDQVANDLRIKVECIQRCVEYLASFKNSDMKDNLKNFRFTSNGGKSEEVFLIDELCRCLDTFLPRNLKSIFIDGLGEYKRLANVLERISSVLGDSKTFAVFDVADIGIQAQLQKLEVTLNNKYAAAAGDDPSVLSRKEKDYKDDKMLALSLYDKQHKNRFLRTKAISGVNLLFGFVCNIKSLDLEALKKREFTIAKPINGIYLSPKKGSGKTGSQLFFPVVLAFEFQRLEGSSPPSTPEKTKKPPEASGLPSTGTAVTSGLK